jgi:hypothetical protein
LAAVSLISCSRDLKNKDDSPPPKPQVMEKEPEIITYEVNEPVYTIVGDEEPNKYQIQVKWPKSSHPVLVMVDRVTLAKVLPSESNSLSFNIQSKKTYLVELFIEAPDGVKTLDARKITTPIDIVFSSTEVLTKSVEIKANRVFFKKTAFIETGKFNFSVKADEIFFEEGSKIINFKNPPSPQLYKDGLSGGNVSIYARIAHGQVQIDLNGSDGGKGLTGLPWMNLGPNGKNGEPGEGFKTPFAHGCPKLPTNGEAAPDGNKGKMGFPGQKGGDSGQLIVEISEQSEIEVIHTEKPGIGGEGGEGGIGQLPGQPGLGGDLEPTGECPRGLPGPSTAKQGPVGDRGPKGAEGEVGNICISVGRGVNQCELKK